MIIELYDQAFEQFVKGLKYVFHIAILIEYPLIMKFFFFDRGEYPHTSLNLVLVYAGASFLMFMALWGHYISSRPRNPGFVEWEHFRTQN